MTSNREKQEARSNDLYRAYGRFAVKFEEMCLCIRQCIISSMHANGLVEQNFIRILLADQTASPLISKLRAFISTIYKDKPSEIKYLEPLFIFCISIYEKRNVIIHGTWFIDYYSSDQTEFDIARGVKDKLTKNGVEGNGYSLTSNTFDELTEKIIIAIRIFRRLQVCLVADPLPSEFLSSEDIDKLEKASKKLF